jgi:hypothetical protein
VKPHSFCRIIISFNPQVCGNYYDRVFCIVRNHKVLYVDLVGTCFDILTKPVPLMQRHVDAYRHKVIMGAHKKLNLFKDKDGVLDTNRASQDSLLESEDADLTMEIPIDDPSQIVLHKEMLQSSQSDLKDIQFSNEVVDFGFTDHGRLSESKQLTVQNKFAYPVRIDWALLPVIDKTTGKEFKNPFNVRPAQQEIPANSNFVFEVDFAPYEPDSYFF